MQDKTKEEAGASQWLMYLLHKGTMADLPFHCRSVTAAPAPGGCPQQLPTPVSASSSQGTQAQPVFDSILWCKGPHGWQTAEANVLMLSEITKRWTCSGGRRVGKWRYPLGPSLVRSLDPVPSAPRTPGGKSENFCAEALSATVRSYGQAEK